jgi:hypothetical protein
MSGLFKSKPQTTTVENDPWKNMPDWLKDAYEKDVGDRQDLLDRADQEGPREIEGINETEQGSFDDFMQRFKQQQELGDSASGMLPGGGYEDKYVGDVVDTTLAGMERQAQRDQLARDSRAASVGGTGNTRAAVGDAVAGQLTGMNMAEMEAKLRSDATKWGAGMNLEEAGLRDQFANSGLERALQGLGIGQAFGEKERSIDQQQNDAGREHIGWLADLLAGTSGMKGPTGSTGTTTQPGNSPFQNILGAGASLGGAWLMSDERVKENIEDADDALSKIRKLGAREYDYKDGFGHTEDRTTGLMAQDIESAGITGAVREFGGVKHVDPYPVLATVVQAVKELDRRVG